MAAAIAVLFPFLHPANKWLQLELVALLMRLARPAAVTRVVPVMHRRRSAQVAKGAFRRAAGFNRDRGLRALTPKNREKLRRAIVEKIPVEELTRSRAGRPRPRSGNGAGGSGDGAASGGASRSVGSGRGRTALFDPREQAPATRRSPTGRPSDSCACCAGWGGRAACRSAAHRDDGRIAKFLFADVPIAARIATMRGLVSGRRRLQGPPRRSRS